MSNWFYPSVVKSFIQFTTKTSQTHSLAAGISPTSMDEIQPFPISSNTVIFYSTTSVEYESLVNPIYKCYIYKTKAE